MADFILRQDYNKYVTILNVQTAVSCPPPYNRPCGGQAAFIWRLPYIRKAMFTVKNKSFTGQICAYA